MLGNGELLRQIVVQGEPVSLILWGPPGTGKTTLARIIAREVNAEFVELSAVTSGKKDVERVIEHARQNWNLGLRTILFVDEIHRFNKAQQDAFLPHVESGLITLIGATTENPSFEVITPLLSRTRVLVLQQLTKDEIILVLKRALKTLKQTKRVSPKALDYLAELADGDARVALGNLELALSFGEKVTPEVVKAAAQRRLPGYDKKGDAHYDVISAFIKSMRGSDPDAAIYYLARMLYAGEDVKFIARRICICASEDVGNADPMAMVVASSAAQEVERIGMPESQIILAQAAAYVACAPKSNSAVNGIMKAMKTVKTTMTETVPGHLRDAHYGGSTRLGHGIGYKYAHDWPNHYVRQQYLPDSLVGERFYELSDQGYEKQMKDWMERIRREAEEETEEV